LPLKSQAWKAFIECLSYSGLLSVAAERPSAPKLDNTNACQVSLKNAYGVLLAKSSEVRVAAKIDEQGLFAAELSLPPFGSTDRRTASIRKSAYGLSNFNAQRWFLILSW
jgi:hypothetical protein